MRLLSISLLFFIFSIASFAQSNSIKGIVIDEKDNSPLLGVNILINELKTGTATNSSGEFLFENIDSGIYTLKISYIGHKSITMQVAVPQTDSLIIFMQESTVNLQEIIVTGNPLESDPKALSQSTISLSPLELQIRSNSTIADMLNYQPGISVRSNGVAASRPVIRGFSNNRILILENGLRMGDLSNTSDDHGVSGDASTSERIEVVRGPASLLYGNNAIGGVVNIITEGIPTFVPHHLDGVINLGAASINKEFNGSADLHYGFDRFAFHGNYFNRENSDYKDGNNSTVNNSDQSSHGYQLGFSFIPSFGTGGLSYSNYKSSYGIPVDLTPPNEEDEEEGPIKISMKKQELRLLMESPAIKGFINSFSLKAGYQDYNHEEIIRSTGEAGTSFGMKSYSMDLSFKHSPINQNIQGVFGVWGLVQNYDVAGEEAFTPNADYSSIAAYLLEMLKLGELNVQVGGRYEFNKISIPEAIISDSLFGAKTKNYNTLSGSLGASFNLTNSLSVFANAATAFRSPTIEELSSFAIHEATGSFDIGDQHLEIEKSIGFDAGLRFNEDNYFVEANGYYNTINNYIFRTPAGLFYNPDDENIFNDSSGFPVYRYSQSNAILYGTELKAQADFVKHFTTTVIFDYVRAYQKDTNENLPQIPPMRFSIEERYTTDYYWFGVQWKLAAKQNKTAQYETSTLGYGLVDLYGGLKIITGSLVHTFNLRVDNILNQPYREHLSSIKEFAFMPGRNIKLNYKFLF